MGISYLIVALALSNMQPDTVVQPAAYMNDRILLRDTGGLMLISGGNPWAAPGPDKTQPQSWQVPGQQPPMPASRPRYITPEELKSLERVPRPQQFYGRAWAPQDRDPLGGLYGYPSFQGIDPLMDPYGVLPYGGMPYEGSRPFTY